jgi:hypothetical protein
MLGIIFISASVLFIRQDFLISRGGFWNLKRFLFGGWDNEKIKGQ